MKTYLLTHFKVPPLNYNILLIYCYTLTNYNALETFKIKV